METLKPRAEKLCRTPHSELQTEPNSVSCRPNTILEGTLKILAVASRRGTCFQKGQFYVQEKTNPCFKKGILFSSRRSCCQEGKPSRRESCFQEGKCCFQDSYLGPALWSPLLSGSGPLTPIGPPPIRGRPFGSITSRRLNTLWSARDCDPCALPPDHNPRK